MARPSRIHIDQMALLHNLNVVKRHAPDKKIIAMVKANAYGCGIEAVAPVLEKHVQAFGVACLEEALALRALGIERDCILFQGIFTPDEIQMLAKYNIQCILHEPCQLKWILETPSTAKIKVGVKVNTGMSRLGFQPRDINNVLTSLQACPWVDANIALIAHFACADEPSHPANQNQLNLFNELDVSKSAFTRSMANSAAILALPDTHADIVRPGIMLYGVSPFPNQTGAELGLMPVMHFTSAISAIHQYPPDTPIGYGGSWQSERATTIGIVPVGYGDGYPRHIKENTPVWVNGKEAPIVGRVSMDMLTVDLSDCLNAQVGDAVELWGHHIPVETIATSAGTIAYELLCQITSRVRKQSGVDNF
ncbi:MAG: alanine racemase [Legionella sp.]|nr:alanine racemase [Legionella sp.]